VTMLLRSMPSTDSAPLITNHPSAVAKLESAEIQLRNPTLGGCDIVEILSYSAVTGAVWCIVVDDQGNHDTRGFNEGDLTAQLPSGVYVSTSRALEEKAFRFINRNGDLEI
jgi:hypothetical protein